MTSRNFALIGAAGYIAPRHLKAIYDTGNRLLAATDPNDSVGILDRHFPDTRFFPEIERFDRYLEKIRRQSEKDRVHYVSICSPNYLHDAHVRLALRVHAHAICEKPLVINPWNIDALADLEAEFGYRVYTVLQLRLVPALVQLKTSLERGTRRDKADVCLTYITRRGLWYHASWKGDEAKSGGLAMNIGVHFFDLLLWLFGSYERSELHLKRTDKLAGFLELERATVRWFLSVDKYDLPNGFLEQGKPAYRSLTVDGEEIEFSSGFTDLHTEVYRDILAGRGFGLREVKPSIELVYRIRTSEEQHTGGAIAHPKLTTGTIAR
jgi:UDP-N-acetyl-2-amino-2-deoxyglucuronate dehydrogenase